MGTKCQNIYLLTESLLRPNISILTKHLIRPDLTKNVIRLNIYLSTEKVIRLTIYLLTESLVRPRLYLLTERLVRPHLYLSTERLVRPDLSHCHHSDRPAWRSWCSLSSSGSGLQTGRSYPDSPSCSTQLISYASRSSRTLHQNTTRRWKHASWEKCRWFNLPLLINL